MFLSLSAFAQTYQYKYSNLNGLEIYGCEMYIKNQEGVFGTSINNITRYVYKNKDEKLLITYHSGAMSSDANIMAQISIDINRADFNKFLTNFQNIRNKCAFAPNS